jgi:hypothetical protein
MLGGTLGAAVLGAVLNTVLHARLGASTGEGIEGIRRMFAGAVEALSSAEREALVAALAAGLARVFAVLVLFGALALVAAWLVPKREIFAPAAQQA